MSHARPKLPLPLPSTWTCSGTGIHGRGGLPSFPSAHLLLCGPLLYRLFALVSFVGMVICTLAFFPSTIIIHPTLLSYLLSPFFLFSSTLFPHLLNLTLPSCLLIDKLQHSSVFNPSRFFLSSPLARHAVQHVWRSIKHLMTLLDHL